MLPLTFGDLVCVPFLNLTPFQHHRRRAPNAFSRSLPHMKVVVYVTCQQPHTHTHGPAMSCSKPGITRGLSTPSRCAQRTFRNWTRSHWSSCTGPPQIFVLRCGELAAALSASFSRAPLSTRQARNQPARLVACCRSHLPCAREDLPVALRAHGSPRTLLGPPSTPLKPSKSGHVALKASVLKGHA